MRKYILVLLVLAGEAYGQLGWRRTFSLGQLSNVDTTGASAGAIITLRSDNYWVDTTLALLFPGATAWTKTGNYIYPTVPTTDSVGVGTATPIRVFEVSQSDASTNANLNPIGVSHRTSATPAANMGVGMQYFMDSNGGEQRPAGNIQVRIQTAADANFTTNMRFLIADSSNSTLTEQARIAPDGRFLLGTTTTDSNLTVAGSGSFTGSVRVDGIVRKQDRVELFASSWDTTSANAPDIGALDNMTVWDFDPSTAETLVVDIRVPHYFLSVDSMQLEVAANSTAGDSASFVISHRDVAVGEAYAGAYADSKTFIADLGTTANVMVRMSVTSALTGIAGDDRVRFKIYRDGLISDDEAGDVRLAGLYLFGKGLK